MGYKYIQEGLSTADATEGQLLIARTIHGQLIPEVDKQLIPRELAAMYIGPAQIEGSSYDVDLETPNTMSVNLVGEGAEIPHQGPLFETFNVKPLKYGLRIEITSEMLEDNKWKGGLLTRAVTLAAKRFAENETSLILEQLDNANSTVTGGAAITLANLVRAKQHLEDEDYEATDCLCGVEVANDLIQIDTFTEADKFGSRETLTRGFLGTVFGIRFYRFSTNAAPSTTYSKYAYVFDRKHAYMIVEKRPITQKAYTIETHDLQGVALTQRIAVRYLRAKAIAKITTS